MPKDGDDDIKQGNQYKTLAINIFLFKTGSEYRDTTISPINTTQSLITSTLEPTNTTDTTSTTTATTSTTATTTTATTSTTAATTTTTTTTTKRRPTTTTIDTTVTTPTIETTIKTETTSTASTGTETQATSPKITTLEADMASAMVNGSSIPAEKNSTENETLCPCACYVETPEHFEKRMQETRKELSVKQNETSRYIAKKISAKDDRPSSQAIGVLAVVLFTVLASVIIVPDILSLVRYLFLHM
ncbi:integumentary mucin C.1-like [Octopus bimaculoides]|nr:integumentary mucin C.1-like [Octopus bimaculoides]